VEIMLLEFTVENYRSIKEPVTLSAVAQKAPKRKSSAKTKRSVKSDAEICPGFQVEGWDMNLLPVMAIFGANASGKSNVLQALSYLLSMMSGTYQQDQSYLFPTSHHPFSLDSASKKQPTKFDLHIYGAGSVYRYHLEIHGNTVIQESLYYLSKATKRPRKLFNRIWSDNLSEYIWENGETFSGAHIQLESRMPRDELYISILKRLEVVILLPLCYFLTCYSTHATGLPLKLKNRVDAQILSSKINDRTGEIDNSKAQRLQDSIVEILKRFDVGITGLELIRSNSDEEVAIHTIHQMATGEEVRWPFEEESFGTQQLFSLAHSIVIELYVGGLLLLDELGTNLHPKITSYIIQLFQNPKTNPKGAQLIFTSHDNTLQRNQLLRRDEIWFTEKKPDQSTDLYSLADFKVRNDLAIDKAYLDGRFGAVPFLPETVEELLGVD
jgi:uncharacterized protein